MTKKTPLTSLSIAQARILSLHCQLLDRNTKLPKGKEGVAKVIEKLGYVQIDTISVIERAHHVTIWTRRPDYTHSMLHDLQAKDRRIFEYWSHAHSYVPISDYRFYIHRMRSYNDPVSKWEKDRLKNFGYMMQPVLERIRNEGPLGSSDFLPPENDRKRDGWWDHRPTKVALELLVMNGQLMVSERRNFNRIYDLTERVLPSGIDKSDPTEDEIGRFFVKRALSSYGVATESEIVRHIYGSNRKLVSKAISEMLASSELVIAEIEGQKDSAYFALTDTLKKFAKVKKSHEGVTFLSPFDNLIILRDRVKRLFGFDYALECYVTPSKRKHGYFVLPILFNGSLIGRLDPKADRKTKVLIINNLLFETSFKSYDEFLPQFIQALSDFARFNQCEKVKLTKVTPSKLKSSILSGLKKSGLA